tara:strand:+ start:584 stop:769 length:186 start_codon:yes stop_codon:yes gene_type:complete
MYSIKMTVVLSGVEEGKVRKGIKTLRGARFIEVVDPIVVDDTDGPGSAVGAPPAALPEIGV